MDRRIERLLEALSLAGGPAPLDIEAFLQSLPDPSALPSPWETWTLIGLVRHLDRQRWAQSVVQNRLKGDTASIAVLGSLGHPEGIPHRGSVPGMPEWEFYFHGRGCCFTHKVVGEILDVDFWDETADYFDLYFYTKYLESLRTPDPPEMRLIELHGSFTTVGIAVDDLLGAGAVVPMPERDRHPVKLHDRLSTADDAVDAFCATWRDPSKRLWLAALIGDWLAAHDAAECFPEVQSITGPRAEACRRIRRERLLGTSGNDASDALRALDELGDADQYIEDALGGPASGLLSAALELAMKRSEPRWLPRIYSVFARMDSGNPIPEPHIWVTAWAFLVRNGYRKDELIAALPNAQGSVVGDAAILAMEHAPQHALLLIRRGLVSRIPCNRTTVAALLASIAKPWCMRELTRALEESQDQEETADARAALLETGDPEAEKAVSAWQTRNPHEREAGTYIEIEGRKRGPFFTMAEHSLNNRASYVRYEMDQIHDRVMALKEVVPLEPTSSKRWWRFWTA